MASRSAAGAAADYALLSYADGRAVSLADSSPMQVSVHLGPATEQEAEQTISCLSSFSMIGNPVSSAGAAWALKLLSENPVIQKTVSSLLRDENIWKAMMQNSEVKKPTSACVVMATQKSSIPGLLEGAPAPAAGGGGNVFHKVFAGDTHIEDPCGAPRKVSVHLGPATEQEAQQTISCLSSFSIIGNPVPAAVVGALNLLSENPAVQKAVSSLMGDENMWKAMMQSPEVKQMSSAIKKTITAAHKSSTPGLLLEGAPAPAAGGGGNVFQVFAADTHIEDPCGAPRLAE
ncbi:hypothetical protein M569_11098 [Genlisea aurea]|uniref:Uncharacterized protein n=1 Tax=Genlisea aurea TaxID=192259 RepID=S8CGI0_9LAMI|nr:hypothetical protein M569_11098 [Genlisea aurea]